MTQQEFYALTGVELSNDEFWAVHEVYCESDVEKYEFCKLWCKMNYKRVAEARERTKAQEQRQRDIDIAWRLLDTWQRKRRARLDVWSELATDHMTTRQEQALNRLGVATRGCNEPRHMGYVWDDIVTALH